MKRNWKRLAALLLAAILMLSLTGLGEDEVEISDDVTTEGIINEANTDIQESASELDIMIGALNNIDLKEDLVDISKDASLQPKQATSEINAAASITLGVNETFKLNAKGLGKNLTFNSSKPKIASITNKGIVKGLKKGTAQISILSGSKVKAKYSVKVVAAPKKVTIPSKNITLGVKESVTIEPTITKNTHTTFTWTSKNKNIATVSKSGKITGKKAGNTTITVQTHNGKSATLRVVIKAAPKKVTLNKTSLTMELYDEFLLKAGFPKGSVSHKLTWTSSDEDIVSVFEDGWVVAEHVGTATITVKTYNGKKATCKVTVLDENEEEETPTPKPTLKPTPEPTRAPGISGEISDYIGTNINDFISKVDDELTETSKGTYENDYMKLLSDSNGIITRIFLVGNHSGKYTIYGIHPGSDCDWAKEHISKWYYLWYTSTSSRVIQYLYKANLSSVRGTMIYLFEDVDGSVLQVLIEKVDPDAY